MNTGQVATQSRGYADEELGHIYALARLFLENGNLNAAEVIINGLLEVAPGFAAALLAKSYILIQKGDFESALQNCTQALRLNENFHEAMLFLIACLLTVGDYNNAGTYLGEIGDKIQNGTIDNPYFIRLYKSQLARFNAPR